MGIRTPDRDKPYNRFRVCRIRPLCHLPVFTTLNLLFCLAIAIQTDVVRSRCLGRASRSLTFGSISSCRLSTTLPSSRIYDSQSVILSCYRNPNRCCLSLGDYVYPIFLKKSIWKRFFSIFFLFFELWYKETYLRGENDILFKTL